jgi:hypothetical protein
VEIRDIIKEAVCIIRRRLRRGQAKIYLFGSRAKGTNANGSDIDIAILGKERIDDLLFLRIKEEVKAIPTLRKIDLVDLNRSAASFKKAVLSHGQAL